MPCVSDCPAGDDDSVGACHRGLDDRLAILLLRVAAGGENRGAAGILPDRDDRDVVISFVLKP